MAVEHCADRIVEQASVFQHRNCRWTDVTLRSGTRRVILCFDCADLTFEAGPRSLSWRRPLAEVPPPAAGDPVADDEDEEPRIGKEFTADELD